MLPDSGQANSSSRRYSLFNLPSAILGSTNNGTSSTENESGQNSHRSMGIMRRGTVDMSGHCQRCKRYEVDLSSTSDDLSATDSELKASRQVISLLQRQLELSRIEKEGLEKLIISQPDKDYSNYSGDISSVQQLVQDFDILKSEDAQDETNKIDPNSRQMLLKLIQTQLYAKDEEIVKMKFNLKEVQNDKEQLTVKLHLLEEDNAKLKNEISILTENIALRDQTIVSLSNEVFEQGNSSESFPSNTRRQSSVGESINNQHSLIKAQRHIAKLIDTLDAYKKTNELLSKNVMQLTERYTQAERRENEIKSQNCELEAKCCQIQSKLLSLLKEIEQSSLQQSGKDESGSGREKQDQEVLCSESVKLLIKRLLEDKSLDIPLSWKEGNKTKKDQKENTKSVKKTECDELGFYIEIEEDYDNNQGDYDSSPMKRNNCRRKLNQDNKDTFRSLETVDEAEESSENHENPKRVVLRHISVDATKSNEARWHMNWDAFIKDFDKISDLSKSREFKALLREGVPQEYRCKVWKRLVDMQIGQERRNYGTDYYQSLLEPKSGSKKTPINPSSKQIELDLLRTLPNNKHFEDLDSSGTVRLRRVLMAYSERNPKVGYCQGMNRLAAVALLILPEEEAFWTLVAIIEKIMPPNYFTDLWLAQVDSSVVLDFTSSKMPNLSNHFKQYGIDLSLFAFFLTIFVDGTTPALFLRIWDSFLFEGDKILFRAALSLLKMHETQLLHLTNSVAINNFLRSSINALNNIDQFFDIAFEWINPLSSKSLRVRRQHHLEMMRSGIQDHKFDCGDDSPNEDSSIISI